MYISHKHKIIFLRNPKTASSSVSDFLVENLKDPNAIYTHVDDTEPPKLAKNVPESIFFKYDNFSWSHLTLEDIVKEGFVRENDLYEYRKIAVIREPLDRQLSFYYHFKSKNQLGLQPHSPPSILEYRSVTKNGYFEKVNAKKKQSDFLKYKNRYIGTYILYENLEDSLKKLMEEMQINITYDLPKHKSSARPNDNHLKLGNEDIIKMKSYFNDDFKLYERIKNR